MSKCKFCKVKETVTNCPGCGRGVCVYCAQPHPCSGNIKPRGK